MSVLVVDFEDSFSHNILFYLRKFNISYECILYANIFDTDLAIYDALLLGPGPGHPNEYSNIKSLISHFITNKKFIFGICLGHQLILDYFNIKISSLDMPLHGIAKSFCWHYDNKNYSVQFYNSLYIKPSDLLPHINYSVIDDMVVSCQMSNIISFQFHPESVGTSCPDPFFKPLIDFLYNKNYDTQVQNQRNL